jgi:hypothetical protein
MSVLATADPYALLSSYSTKSLCFALYRCCLRVLRLFFVFFFFSSACSFIIVDSSILHFIFDWQKWRWFYLEHMHRHENNIYLNSFIASFMLSFYDQCLRSPSKTTEGVGMVSDVVHPTPRGGEGWLLSNKNSLFIAPNANDSELQLASTRRRDDVMIVLVYYLYYSRL